MDEFIAYLKMGLEVLAFAAVIYAFIRFVQETQGSAVFQGFLVMLGVFVVGLPLVAEWLELRHLGYVTRNGIGFVMIALLVIFSPELRAAFVRLGESRVLKGLGRREVARTVEEELVQAVERLSRRGLGALIVLEREIGIASFTEGGVRLEALISAPLLVSIFFKDTPLHDGAVIIRGRRIISAGCIVPLTDNLNLPKALGTRHRAAIGATEENDAIAIVVSEETSIVSVARRGELEREITSDRLREILAEESAAATKEKEGE